MSERPDPRRPDATTQQRADEQTEEWEEPERVAWSSEDDELLLLDEIEETPDDERVDDLV
jgi:hypothetical protein